MEDILASIRRIIADDQSLPRGENATRLDVAPEPHDDGPPPSQDAAPVHVLHPFHHLAPDPVSPAIAETAAAPSHNEASALDRDHEQAATLAAAMARGAIAAPQYANPDGPERSLSRDAPEPPGIDSDLRTEQGSHASLETEEAPPVIDQDVHAASDQAERNEAAGPSGAAISATTQHSVVSAFNTLAAARLAGNSEELRALAKEMLRPLIVTWLDANLPALVERLVRDEIERVGHGGHSPEARSR